MPDFFQCSHWQEMYRLQLYLLIPRHSCQMWFFHHKFVCLYKTTLANINRTLLYIFLLPKGVTLTIEYRTKLNINNLTLTSNVYIIAIVIEFNNTVHPHYLTSVFSTMIQRCGNTIMLLCGFEIFIISFEYLSIIELPLKTYMAKNPLNQIRPQNLT